MAPCDGALFDDDFRGRQADGSTTEVTTNAAGTWSLARGFISYSDALRRSDVGVICKDGAPGGSDVGVSSNAIAPRSPDMGVSSNASDGRASPLSPGLDSSYRPAHEAAPSVDAMGRELTTSDPA